MFIPQTIKLSPTAIQYVGTVPPWLEEITNKIINKLWYYEREAQLSQKEDMITKGIDIISLCKFEALYDVQSRGILVNVIGDKSFQWRGHVEDFLGVEE